MPSAPKQDFQQEFNNKREKFMTNGTIHEEEDFEKPAAIEADIKDMEKRKRVSYIMNSDAFRAELENIIDYQLSHGPHPASVMALQHLADILLPSNGTATAHASSKDTATSSGQVVAHSKSCMGVTMTPISDVRGADASTYGKGERFLRCKLSSLFRLVDQAGWNQAGASGHTHISARVSGEQDSILINPSGLAYQEISATTLIKVDQHGNVLHPGSTTFGTSKSATGLHTALHRARPDVRCILHLKQTDVQAVSSMKQGLLKTSVDACVLGSVSSHPFVGLSLSDEEKDSLGRDLGAVNKIMFLSNQGAVVCGATVEETWQLTTHLVSACQSQLKCLQAAGGNMEQLSLIEDEVAQKAFQSAWAGDVFEEGRQWKFGEMLFEVKMREFDNTGLRTGYIYKNPLVKIPTKPKFDVEVPPASSSMGYFSDSETLRATKSSRDRYIHSGGYQRVEAEIFSDGDTPDDSKTKIKWVRKDDTGELVKIDGPHQFAPVFSGRKEMKAKIETMKDDRDLNKSTSGYQSRILDGLSETDARKYQEVQGVNPNAVAAFSKGIIQKDYQKDAVILTDYSAQNPFDAVTDDEIETYKKQAQRRAQGLPAEEPAPVPEPQTSPHGSHSKASFASRVFRTKKRVVPSITDEKLFAEDANSNVESSVTVTPGGGRTVTTRTVTVTKSGGPEIVEENISKSSGSEMKSSPFIISNDGKNVKTTRTVTVVKGGSSQMIENTSNKSEFELRSPVHETHDDGKVTKTTRTTTSVKSGEPQITEEVVSKVSGAETMSSPVTVANEGGKSTKTTRTITRLFGRKGGQQNVEEEVSKTSQLEALSSPPIEEKLNEARAEFFADGTVPTDGNKMTSRTVTVTRSGQELIGGEDDSRSSKSSRTVTVTKVGGPVITEQNITRSSGSELMSSLGSGQGEGGNVKSSRTVTVTKVGGPRSTEENITRSSGSELMSSLGSGQGEGGNVKSSRTVTVTKVGGPRITEENITRSSGSELMSSLGSGQGESGNVKSSRTVTVTKVGGPVITEQNITRSSGSELMSSLASDESDNRMQIIVKIKKSDGASEVIEGDDKDLGKIMEKFKDMEGFDVEKLAESFGESSKKDKKARAATMPHPAGSPTSDTETGGHESGHDKGMTTGGETENEGTGTLDAKGKSAKPKKNKSFKLFGKNK